MTLVYNDSSRIRINVTTNADLTGATTLNLLVKKPDNTTDTWTLTVVSAALGTCYYITSATDFEDIGDYYMQAHVVFSGDNTELYGDKVRVHVYERLEVS
jgi:hypothetical protein